MRQINKQYFPFLSYFIEFTTLVFGKLACDIDGYERWHYNTVIL